MGGLERRERSLTLKGLRARVLAGLLVLLRGFMPLPLRLVAAIFQPRTPRLEETSYREL
jgi:hypothetical protein